MAGFMHYVFASYQAPLKPLNNMVMENMKKFIQAILISSIAFTNVCQATLMDFTGGTITENDGVTTHVSDSLTSFQNVSSYIQDGFKVQFIFSGTPSSFASIVGNYYNTSNDVAHWHWDDGIFGEVTEVIISKVDNSTFDLGGFQVTTNTANGGGSSDGFESVAINSSKMANLFTVDSDDWGLGNGTDPLITIDPLNDFFKGITWFSFTNNSSSSSVGMGIDNIFLDEAGDPNGFDPTTVSSPATMSLLFLGLAGMFYRRKNN